MNKDKSIDVVGHRKRAKDKFALSEGKGFADYELLELILFYSIPRIDVKPIAKALLRKFGSLAGVLFAPKDELQKFERISDSTINLFRIITETNIRICKEKLCNKDLPVLANVDALIDFCRSAIAYKAVEELHILFLDASFHLLGTDILSKGVSTSVRITPEEVVQKAKENRAPNIVLVHNHPSGYTSPSKEDILITSDIFRACRYMNINLQEHLIISPYEYFSFRTEGLLPLK